MQAVTNEHSTSQENSQPLTISAEMIAYAVLIIVALVLRFASLGVVPMTDAEAIQALPAYHAVNTNAPGTPQEAPSVMLYWLQSISFTIFGGTEFSARLAGVLGSFALILIPLTMRQRLGRELTFLLAVTLAFSPIAFTAGRFSDSAIWTMVFAIASLSAIWQYLLFPLQEKALIAAAVLGTMVFLTGSTGIILLLVWILAFALTIAWMVYAAPDERDSPGDDILQQVRDFIANLPLLPMVGLIAGLVFVASTGFFLDTSGLNIVAETVRTVFVGFMQPATPNAPNLWAVLSLFTYEPILVVLGIISGFMMISSRTDTVIDRFMMSWFVVGFLFLVIYRGSTPAQSLILALPLIYLTARLIGEMLVNYMPAFLSLDSYTSNDPNDYIWVKWTVALVVVAGFIMLSLYLATVGRAMLAYTGTFWGTDQQTVLLYARMGWFLIMVVLMIVLYFLFASMWGNRNVMQGYILGSFAFMLLIGIGTGWNTAVINVRNAAELWYTTGIPKDAAQLRETLFDVSRRDTRGFPAINMVIVQDEAAGVTGDGLIAWMVRDFDNARFVESIAEARQGEIILLPELEEDPDLGGSYVGQRFVIRENWIPGIMGLQDWISWYTHRKIRPFTLPEDVTILWLRIDVYDGVPANQRP